MSRLALAVAFAVAFSGCQSAPKAPPRASLGSELKQQDEQLVGQRFRTLLDFETDADTVFTKADPPGRRTSPGHTGGGAFAAERYATFKIDPLLYGTKLPGEWTLLGAYVRCAADTTVTAELLLDGQASASFSRNVAGGSWAFVGIDLTDPNLAAPLQSAGRIGLRLSAPDAEYDDVLLVNNTRDLVNDSTAGGWRITQRGGVLRAISKAADHSIPLAGAAASGWTIDEISARRLCLHRDNDFWTLLPDGRSILNGAMRFDSGAAPAARSETVFPPGADLAKIDIDDECGRIDRDSDGDANNDGYNERHGSYELIATSPRPSFKIIPGTAPAKLPLFEIAGLPPGKITGMLEGKLIQDVTRLPNGHVLVLLPLTIDRPAELTLRASDNP